MAGKVIIKRSAAGGAPVAGALAFGELGWDEAGQNLYIGNNSGGVVCIAGSFKANASHGHFQASIVDLPITVTNGGTGRNTAITEGQVWVSGASGVPAGDVKLTFASGVLRVGGATNAIEISASGSASLLQAIGANQDLNLNAAEGRPILFGWPSKNLGFIHGGGLGLTYNGTYSCTLAPGILTGNMTITFPDSLPSGDAILHISSTGKLSWVLV